MWAMDKRCYLYRYQGCPVSVTCMSINFLGTRVFRFLQTFAFSHPEGHFICVYMAREEDGFSFGRRYDREGECVCIQVAHAQEG